MCLNSKQAVNALVAILWAGAAIGGHASAEERVGGEPVHAAAGGVAIGDGAGGITDRAYVTAPPNYFYVVEKERGSFLDCGEGQDSRATDEDGRDIAALRCGVTLTETIVIPAAAASAKIIVHY